jgi:hypothetical protein
MSWLGRLGFGWGVLGVGALLAEAVFRLWGHALEAVAEHRLSPAQWAFAVGWTGLLWLFEGYRGFQRRFSPRVVARALYLAHHPRPLHLALAPAYCIGLLYASPRRLRSEWTMVVLVVALVLLVRELEQPLRGLVDLGVVVALSWGLGAVLLFAVRALWTGEAPEVGLDLPEGRGAGSARTLAQDSC